MAAEAVLEVGKRNVMEILQKFTAVGLEDIGKANFMNRVDTKFPLRSEVLWQKILPEIVDDYYIVEIDGLRYMEYKTVYFDTPDNMFFTSHHNGKLDRYKVRKRMYVDTKTSFLEVKHKNNKGKTSGSRVSYVSEKYRTVITLHRPHPRKELLEYQVKQLVELLKQEGLI